MADDPDETEGRRLYSARADTLARSQVNIASRRVLYRTTRCEDGRLLRRDPQPDDPYLETDIGKCPECDGRGCDDEEGHDERT